jgi:hypothetical protein
MIKNTQNLQPVGSFKSLDNSPDPLSAHFEIVTGHRKTRMGFGAPKEVVETTTYPDLMRKIAAMPEGNPDAVALRATAQQIEPTLDFSDEWGDMSGIVTYGR